MKRETVKRAIELDSEIRELKQYAHAVMNVHYDKLVFRIEVKGKYISEHGFFPETPVNIYVDKRHNKRLLAVVDEIIAELEKELEEL